MPSTDGTTLGHGPAEALSSRQRFADAQVRLGGAQKPGAGVPAYTRWVNRRLARRVAATAYAIGATPNQVTVASVGLSAVGVLVLLTAPVTWWSGVLAATALAAGYLFDSADGQVARLSGTGSPAGEWLDHVADAFRTPAIHVSVAAAWIIADQPYPWLPAVALAFSVLMSGQFMSQILAEQLVRRAKVERRTGGNRSSWVLLPVDPGTSCWLFVLWGFPPLFAFAYVALFVAHLVHVSVSLRRRYNDLKRVSPTLGTDT